MIVADTSVWVDHIRGAETPLADLLGESTVLLHPFVYGELLLHGLPRKGDIAESLTSLDPAPVASPEEVAAIIGWAKLASKGIGYVDAHLLVSARMLPNARLLTFDKNLRTQAERLEVAYQS